MLALCAFPLLYIAGVILVFCGIAPGQLKDGATLLTHILVTGAGVMALLFGTYLHREMRRCRDVPGYFAEHYSPFRDL